MLRVTTISAMLKATSEFWSCNDPSHLKTRGCTVSAVHVIKGLENDIRGEGQGAGRESKMPYHEADTIRTEAQSS